MEVTYSQAPKKPVSLLVLAIIVLAVVAAGISALYYYNSLQTSREISSLQSAVSALQGAEKSMIQLEDANGTYPGTNYFTSSSTGLLNAVAIYNYANQSVVTVEGLQSGSQVLGSGFVVIYDNSYYIVTNYHVVDDDTDVSVTFSDGNAYSATVIGSDPYSDLAVLTTTAPSSEYHPLSIVSSSTLVVGEPVLAIGNPYGLSGSETEGIVSQLGRTIDETAAGNYAIANIIQISVPINPGNSGGPLMNSVGQVVGITTAVVSGSQGVGFAIPSDTILEELPYLIATGSFNLHPYLGITSVDMSYDIAQAVDSNVTYGILIQTVVSGSPAATAGLRGGTSTIIVDGAQIMSGGDIIVSINGTKIENGDALSSWLEEHGLPGEVVYIGIIRSGTPMTVELTLGTRPSA